MINKKLIDETDAERLRALLDTNVTAEICDNSVGNIFMWKDTLDTEILDGTFCIAEHYEGHTYFALRCSDGNYIERINCLIQNFGAPLYLCSMTDSEVALLKAAFGEKFSYEGEDGAADYIYDADSLRTFKGKKYHSQKNHLNAFLRTCKDYRFVPYTADKEGEVAAFFDRYEESVGDTTDSAKKESLACRRLLPMLSKLPVDARMLYSGDELIGFTVMERIGDTLMIHIEKGLPAFRGVYPMLIQLEAGAYPDVKYINREEDDGNEGLRRSKESYHPVMLTQKYLGIIE